MCNVPTINTKKVTNMCLSDNIFQVEPVGSNLEETFTFQVPLTILQFAATVTNVEEIRVKLTSAINGDAEVRVTHITY